MGPPREDHGRVEIPQAERQVGGRLLSAGLALGSAAGALSWAVNDVPLRSDTVAAIGTAAGVLLALVCLRVRWDRRSPALLAVPAVAAVVLIALGCWNTGGTDSPYTGWYLVSSVAGAYFLDRRGTFLLAGAVLVAGLLPFVYQEHHSRLAVSHYLLYCGFGAAVAVAFQRQRHRARAAALRAEQLADQDPLTGVANRRGFERRLSAEVSRARRGPGTFAVLLIDLDRFKQLNDGAGHAAGDEALRRVALAISGAIRGMDVAARWGGDEFAVLLADADGAAAAAAATRIAAAIERIGGAGAGPRFALSASVGLAVYPHDGRTLDELMEEADRRLRRVKRARARDRARGLRPVQFVPEREAVPELPADPAPPVRRPALQLSSRPGSRLRTRRVLLAVLALDLVLAAVAVFLVLRHGMPVAGLPFLVAIVALHQGRWALLARENARLGEAASRTRQHLTVQSRASLVALGTALEARDGYTGSHGSEVVALARAVGARLDLDSETVEEVATVALLHDLGKIGLPDEILRKPCALSEDERAVVREHPLIGERILRTVPGLEAVATAVRHEHERWDGEGYPDGLAGEDIPLASRITLVCDAFHAMTSDRPYRTALPREEALAELARHAGTQFDPAVVTALIAIERDAELALAV